MQTQFEEIERTRVSMEQQKSVERLALDQKLKTAANMRDENIKKMLDRLKEHVRSHSLTSFISSNFFENSFDFFFFQFDFVYFVHLTLTKSGTHHIFNTPTTFHMQHNSTEQIGDTS